MGFEFQLIAVTGSSSKAWKDAGKCFATQVAPYVKTSPDSTARSALNTVYELLALPSSTWGEDFVIVQEKDKCYVCFHRGADEQLLTILDLLTNCCATAGIAGVFGEL